MFVLAFKMLTKKKVRIQSGTLSNQSGISQGGFTVYCTEGPKEALYQGKCTDGAVQTRTPYSDILLILSCKAHLWFFKSEAMEAT